MATIDGSAIRERPGHSAPNDRKSPLAVHFQDDADSVGMYHSQKVAFVDRISTLSKAFLALGETIPITRQSFPRKASGWSMRFCQRSYWL